MFRCGSKNANIFNSRNGETSTHHVAVRVELRPGDAGEFNGGAEKIGRKRAMGLGKVPFETATAFYDVQVDTLKRKMHPADRRHHSNPQSVMSAGDEFLKCGVDRSRQFACPDFANRGCTDERRKAVAGST